MVPVPTLMPRMRAHTYGTDVTGETPSSERMAKARPSAMMNRPAGYSSTRRRLSGLPPKESRFFSLRINSLFLVDTG